MVRTLLRMRRVLPLQSIESVWRSDRAALAYLLSIKSKPEMIHSPFSNPQCPCSQHRQSFRSQTTTLLPLASLALPLEHTPQSHPHTTRTQPAHNHIQAVISFPNHYAAAFGEFGTRACTRWTRELAAAGARVRGCILWQLDYTRRL